MSRSLDRDAKSSRRVLVLDALGSFASLKAGLARHDLDVTVVPPDQDPLTPLKEGDFAAVLLDLEEAGVDGTGLCDRCVRGFPDIPVIVTTTHGRLESAIAALRAGASDLLLKPLDSESVARALERAVKDRALRAEVKRLRCELASRPSSSEMIGASPAMKVVFDLVERIAETDSTVLISGETGTGKELVARSLHRRSRRADGPFVAVNCGALPEPLLEAELFGHAKGAFTDARGSREGLLVHATGGTLFLDEVAVTPASMQVKLLRALQERRVRPVGGDDEVEFDARIIAASNRPLEDLVEEGRLREDLFYRLNVIHIRIPPLRARGNDALLLAQHFLERHAARAGKEVRGLTCAAAEKLLAYSWPGNVRELQNCIERAVALTRYDHLTVEDLPEKVRSHTRSHLVVGGDRLDELVPIATVERRYVRHVLEATGGNKTLAAQILGLDRKTLYRKLARYESAPTGSGAWPTLPPAEPTR